MNASYGFMDNYCFDIVYVYTELLYIATAQIINKWTDSTISTGESLAYRVTIRADPEQKQVGVAFTPRLLIPFYWLHKVVITADLQASCTGRQSCLW